VNLWGLPILLVGVLILYVTIKKGASGASGLINAA